MTQTHEGLRHVKFDELAGLVGTSFGPSKPLKVDQDRINRFADATDDHQWLHVDPEKAAAGPFGKTIAHGYLTMSLFPALLWSLLEVDDASGIVNYGMDKLRFPAPVPVDSEVTLTVTIAKVEDAAGGCQVTFNAVFDVVGGKKPACIADILFRYYKG